MGDIGPESAHYEVLPVIDDLVAPRVDVAAATDATGKADGAARKAVVQVAAAEPAAGR